MKLREIKQRYSTFGRELLAAYLAVKRFKHYLKGHQLVMVPDHKPLTYVLKSGASNALPGRHGI